jgi:1,4-dihydroxy-2-naphthoate octaprenyltransferase
MNVNFAMWRKASWELIKMDQKADWERLDVVSKWLIATRSAVTTVTIYSCIIGGLLAARGGYFSFVPWFIVTLGLFVAHGANNLLNDYTDYSRGIDKDNYFRTQYGVHPLVQGFWDKPTQLRWFFVTGVLAFLTGVYALVYTHFNPIVLVLFVLGAVTLLLYTYPLKYWALGELAIFLIWGPIMVGGVYLVLSGQWDWMVALAGVPFGLSVASINVAKHIDKMEDDKRRGVGTFPVRVGQTFARYTNITVIAAAYLVVVFLVVTGFFSTFMLLVFLAGQLALYAIMALSKPRPQGPPLGFEAFWPTWFSGFCFLHNRRFGGLFILGVLLDTAVRALAAVRPLPVSVNVLGLAALVIGIAIEVVSQMRAKAKTKAAS